MNTPLPIQLRHFRGSVVCGSIRAGGADMRAAALDARAGFAVSGQAVAYNADSHLLQEGGRKFVERVAPGAFTRTLMENPDVVLLFGHDSTRPLARVSAKNLSIRDGAAGLAFESDLEGTTHGRESAELVKAGIVRGVSIGFIARRDKWTAGSGNTPDVRTLLDVDLHEISLVVWPAYESGLARGTEAQSVQSPHGEYTFAHFRAGISPVAKR